MAVAGAGDPKTLVVREEYGLWHVTTDSRSVTSGTLEGALIKAAPEAPAEYLHHAAEVLLGVLGIGGEQ